MAEPVLPPIDWARPWYDTVRPAFERAAPPPGFDARKTRALIVGVLRNGLTLVGIDNLYQNIATGVLVIAAVALDQLSRRRLQ